MGIFTVGFIIGFIISGSTAWLFYLAFRLRMWKEYYGFNRYTPDPRDIDRGDKMQALIWACVAAAFWPITLPVYVVYRYLVSQRKRRLAEAVADRDEYDYWTEKPREHR